MTTPTSVERYRGKVLWHDLVTGETIERGIIERAIVRLTGLVLDVRSDRGAYAITLKPAADGEYRGLWELDGGASRGPARGRLVLNDEGGDASLYALWGLEVFELLVSMLLGAMVGALAGLAATLLRTGATGLGWDIALGAVALPGTLVPLSLLAVDDSYTLPVDDSYTLPAAWLAPMLLAVAHEAWRWRRGHQSGT